MTDPEQGVAVVSRNALSKRQKKKLRKSLLKEQLYEFGSTTTLHGIRYVTDKRLSVVEKLFWFFIFSVSVGFCLYRISVVWTKWQDSPVLVTVNEQLVPVGSVPFPSVTICPQMKTKASIFNYTDKFQKITNSSSTDEKISASDIKLFQDLMLICKDTYSNNYFYYYPIDDANSDQENATYSTVNNLLKVAPTLEDIMESCIWHGTLRTCSDFFQTVFTAEGVCFNMNSIQPREMFTEENIWSEYGESSEIYSKKGWDVNGNYDPNEEHPYPRRGWGNGAKSELKIRFSETIMDRDPMCNSLNNGFKVYIQHPDSMPTSSMHSYDVASGKRTSFALKFDSLSTAEKLHDVPSETRQCFFPEDQPLRYFKTYTASNCNIECLANITYQECSCIGFNMPRNSSTRVCKYSDQDCMEYAQEKLARKQSNYMYLQSKDKPETCRCLPSCNSVDYDADIISSDFKIKTYLRAVNSKLQDDYLDNMTKSEIFSLMRMYYKHPRYISMRRSELYGMTDFLANCGGLLGLFLGFSFLSIVEIIYFFTLRPWSLRRIILKSRSTIVIFYSIASACYIYLEQSSAPSNVPN